MLLQCYRAWSVCRRLDLSNKQNQWYLGRGSRMPHKYRKYRFGSELLQPFVSPEKFVSYCHFSSLSALFRISQGKVVI